MKTTLQIENNTRLDRLLTTNPAMEKKVRNIVRKIIADARDQVARAAEGVIKDDPRKTAHAIRSTVYKEVFGGNVNILSARRRVNGPGTYQKPRKLRQGQVGGNRIKPSMRTKTMESYVGFDRTFVLRWIEGGTTTRASRYGNRGSIAARMWFGSASTAALQNAASQFENLLSELIDEALN